MLPSDYNSDRYYHTNWRLPVAWAIQHKAQIEFGYGLLVGAWATPLATLGLVYDSYLALARWLLCLGLLVSTAMATPSRLQMNEGERSRD